MSDLRDALTPLIEQLRTAGEWMEGGHPVAVANARVAIAVVEANLITMLGPTPVEGDPDFDATDPTYRRAALAAPQPEPPLDVERLARAIQSTILTSPGEYTGPGMGAYRQHWEALTDRQKGHVMGDAKALAAAYRAPVEPT